MANSETVSPKRTRRASEEPKNPFEDLPHELVENILSFLPIKEATEKCCTIGSSRFAKSMLLNRKFLFGWAALRHTQQYITLLVDHLFATHRGTDIQSLQLYIDPKGIEHLLRKWLEICLQKGIEDIDLYLLEPRLSLDADFINGLKKLQTLRLVNCGFELPCKLQGMKLLKTLALWRISFSGDKLETLVDHCKFLESVDLLFCTDITWVRIHARDHKYFKALRLAGYKDMEVVFVDSPTLEHVFYSGNVTKLYFHGSPKVIEAYIHFEPSGQRRRYLPADDFEKLAIALSNASVLSAPPIVPEALTSKFRQGVFGEACYNFLNLKHLRLIMEGGLFCNPYDIIMFMKHCPLLETLFIDMNDYNFDCGPYWELHQRPKLEKMDHTFDQLKFIKIMGFKFLKSELHLVKILLNKATHLEFLILITPKNGRFRVDKTQLPKYNPLFNAWKVASDEINMLLYEHSIDRSPEFPNSSYNWYPHQG